MTKCLNASSSSAGSAASVELEILQPQSKISKPKSGNHDNAALDRCRKAWQRTFDLASIDPKNDSLAPPSDNTTYFARKQASLSFRDAMPPLAGYENISDFIACTTYAMLKDILYKDDCQRLFTAAKIALAVLKAQPKSPAPPA